MARRKKSGGDEGGGYSWMDTYGDLVTLLLCFFVLLFSFSSIDSAKWQALVGAFSGSTTVNIAAMSPAVAFEPAINDPFEGMQSSDDSQSSGDVEIDDEKFNELQNNIQKFFGGNDDVIIESMPNVYKIVIRFPENILFDSARANILPAAHETLNKMAELFTGNTHLIYDISIEGHTDDRILSAGSPYKDNMELSNARAWSAYNYLSARNPALESMLTCRGLGPNKPIEKNDSDPNRQKNRRVEFVIESIREVNSNY